jgi:prepilin-type N-terminal cleavage/methylation domain-containing protein/prepilin-type processing-associated H-X9-DG protein
MSHKPKYKLPLWTPRSSSLSGKGFTLVELLTVIAVIGILAALVFVGAQSMLENGRSVKCVANLRSIYGFSMLYAADNRGELLQNGYLAPGQIGFVPWQTYLYDYAGGSGAEYRKIIRCPSDNETVPEDTAVNRRVILTENDYPSYGLNQFLGIQDDRTLGRPTKIANVKNPNLFVYFGDSWHRTERIAGPTKFRASAFLNPYRDDPLFGRHKGSANVIFLDGHVTVFNNVNDAQDINSKDLAISGKYWLKR